ncbi:MAG: hypothetical protein Q8Q12_17820 [bacterium]|nr:hypothetical protein [bacterium]
MRMKAAPLLVLAVLAALLFADRAVLYAASPRSSKDVPDKTFSTDLEAKERVRVLKVITGDTLLIDYRGREETVRLKGLDSSDKDTRRAAEEARRLARLLKGKEVELAASSSSEEERDEKGRLLVTLYAEGENVNEMLAAMERFGFDAQMDTLRKEPERPPEARSGPPPPPANKKKTPANVITTITYDKVYVTPRDKTYHKANCRLLSGIRAVPVLREYAAQQGYKPCRRCKP